jgi:SRSO17 transposase
MKGRQPMNPPDEATARVLAGAQPELEALCARIAGRFRRLEVRRRLRNYLAALLAPLPRKNGWQIAEQVGERSPDGVQELLNAAKWDADGVRDDLRTYVLEHLGDPEGVLVVDETGFLKKGEHSVGVARQYTGTTGQVENCQVGVFLTYATEAGRTFLDRELYLPQEWTDDPERCRKAGVPEEVEFATKPQLAERMLARVLAAKVPAGWVTGDAVYGRDGALRRFLEAREQPYVLGVAKDERVCPDSEWLPVKSGRADQLTARLPVEAWERHSCGAGSKGPRLYDWAWIPLWRPAADGWRHWLLVRRSRSDPKELAYFLVFARETTELSAAVRAVGRRWSVEESFESGKELVGLDQYEVRRWDAWYRYITLAAVAHAFLCVLRARALAPEGAPPVSSGAAN